MKDEQIVGKHGEGLAMSALRSLGIEMVEKIGTPVRLHPVKTSRPNTFQVIWGERVSGDHRGILPGGRSVLAETKTILDRNLRYSDLREHQPERLSKHAELGGLSLLIWVHQSGVYIMEWTEVGIPGFGPKLSIDTEMASKLEFHLDRKVILY